MSGTSHCPTPWTPSTPDPDTAGLLAAHDRLLRGEPEVVGADDLVDDAGLWLAVFGEDGFITHQGLGEQTATDLGALVGEVIAHFSAKSVARFEWKTRGHDVGNDRLIDALVRAGLRPEPPETVMMGETGTLMAPVDIPEPLVLRKAGTGGVRRRSGWSVRRRDLAAVAWTRSVSGHDRSAGLRAVTTTTPYLWRRPGG